MKIVKVSSNEFIVTVNQGGEGASKEYALEAKQAVVEAEQAVVYAEAQVTLTQQAVTDAQGQVSLAEAQVGLAQAQVTLATTQANAASDSAEAIALAQNIAFKGGATLATVPNLATGAQTWQPTVSGTYTNMGGLAVNLADGVIFLNYDGTTWRKSTTPIVLTNYATKLLVNPTLDIVSATTSISKNIFNKLKTIAGYINNSGTLIASNNTLSSDFIPVVAGQVYRFSSGATLAGGVPRFVFYNTSQLFSSKVDFTSGTGQTVTAPINGYIIINLGSIVGIGSGSLTNNSLVNQSQFELGSVATSYESFEYFLRGEQIKNFKTTFGTGLVFSKVNLGSVYRSDTGAVVNITGAGFPNGERGQNPISVVPGGKYYFSGSVGGSVGVAGFNESLVQNSRILDDSGLSVFGSVGVSVHDKTVITVPVGVFFLGISTKDNINFPLILAEVEESTINDALSKISTNLQKLAPIKVIGISSTKFEVSSICENGDYLVHIFERIVRTSPQLEDGWLCSDITHNGNLIIQGNFNWIYQSNIANEGVFVGIGHGCEVFIDEHWFLDGRKFDPTNIVGVTLEGSEFSFQWTSEIYAANASDTTAGNMAVAKLPLEKSTRHQLSGVIKGFNEINYRNKLIFLRDNVGFVACYPSMLAGYSPYLKYIQIENIENTVNYAVPASQVAVAPSTTIINGQTYTTSDGMRAELAFCAHMWSDYYDYKVTNIMYNLLNTDQAQYSIQSASGPSGVSSRNKLYFQPVVTSVIASARSLAIDVFNEGQFLEVECFRKITL